MIGTPIDLTRVIKINKPYQRVRYELQEIGQPTLAELLMKKFGKKNPRGLQPLPVIVLLFALPV
jgi:predicted GTPase